MRTPLALLACMLVMLAAPSMAQKQKNDSRADGKVTVIVTQEVKDYNAWRKVYDENVRSRRTSRVRVMGIFTDVKNPNMVTVIAEFQNAALVDSVTANSQFKSALDDAGVVGSPDIKTLKRMSR